MELQHGHTRTSRPVTEKRKQRKILYARLKNNWDIYLLIALPLIPLMIYHYVPMFGILLAFKDYKIFDGILGSSWVGLQHFERMLTDPKFMSVTMNTLLINFYKLIFQMPIPIILALLLNEVRLNVLKRSVQTLTYLPHFLSYVVVAGIAIDLLSPSTGLVGAIVRAFGYEPTLYLGSENFFRPLMVIIHSWKESGWSAIIYLAALTAIDQEQYEAAKVDGAGRFRQMWSISLPGMASTIMFIMIVRVANAFHSDTEQTLLLYNPLVYGVGDVLGTYIYREGLENAAYSYTTAVGLLTGVISTVLVVVAHRIGVRYTGKGIW